MVYFGNDDLVSTTGAWGCDNDVDFCVWKVSCQMVGFIFYAFSVDWSTDLFVCGCFEELFDLARNL